MSGLLQFIVNLGYFATAITFIFALKRMSHPSTARSGIVWAGYAMAFATLITFIHPDVHSNYLLIIIAILIGGIIANITAKSVKMTDMPQMIAIYNGVGSASAACIAAITLLRTGTLVELHSGADFRSVPPMLLLAGIGGLIGVISFTGSIIAWMKLDGRMNKTVRIKGRNLINAGLLMAAILFVIMLANVTPEATHPDYFYVVLLFVVAAALGILIAIPIGGADMPVVISLFNALTGLAVAFEGIATNNYGLVVSGMVVGAAGSLLTILMAKAMNRSLSNVLFSNFGDAQASTEEITGSLKPVGAGDAAMTMAYAQKVIIVPGYGLAVAQAQHKVAELTKLLEDKGVDVKFAIHPVAGRMPGHMNVLLAEAGIPYDLIFDLDEINDEFKDTDAVLVIGANDVVNPVARTDKSSPIYGMPILNADMAKQVFVIKRGQGAGFSGIENHLFYLDNTNMVYGDAQKMVNDMIAAVKSV